MDKPKFKHMVSKPTIENIPIEILLQLSKKMAKKYRPLIERLKDA